MCSNRQIKKVLIAGKMATENEAAIKEVVDAVEEKGIVADIIGDILTDADAVQTLEQNQMLFSLKQSENQNMKTLIRKKHFARALMHSF